MRVRVCVYVCVCRYVHITSQTLPNAPQRSIAKRHSKEALQRGIRKKHCKEAFERGIPSMIRKGYSRGTYRLVSIAGLTK